ERDEVPVAGDDQRVDLDEARVALDEELHELRQELMQLLLLVWVEPEPEADPPGLIRLNASRRVKGRGGGLPQRLRRDLLDVHAARRGRDDRDALGRAVDEETEIKLPCDVRPGLDVDPVYRQPLGPALVRDEPLAEHRLRVRRHLFDGSGELHAARLAAPAGVHLRLDDPELAAQRLGRLACLLLAGRDASFRDWDAVLGEQRLRLVFVKIHWLVVFVSWLERDLEGTRPA